MRRVFAVLASAYGSKKHTRNRTRDECDENELTYAAALSRRFISLASQNFNDLRTHMESCQSHAQESSAQPTYTLYTERDAHRRVGS